MQFLHMYNIKMRGFWLLFTGEGIRWARLYNLFTKNDTGDGDSPLLIYI
jgi:hypothetical protein